MVFDLGNWAACGECGHLHSTSAELDNETPINVLITEWKGLSTGEHSHRVEVANLFTNSLEVLKTLYAQSHKNNELTVLIDLGRYASLLGHPPSAVIDKLKKLSSAVLAMREPLHLAGSISGSPRSTAESLP